MSPENATDDGTADATPRAPTRVVVVTWLLAVVALAPPVTVLVLASQVLGGSLDRQYFGSYSAEDQSLEAAVVPPGIGFWDRWSVLVSAVPYEPALLTTTGVVALLAGLHLAGGSRWPLGQIFRWAAAAVAWLVAAMAATFLLLTLVSAQRPADEQSFSAYSSSDLLTVVAPGAAMAVVLGFAAVSGILLVGPAVPAPAREGHEAPEALEEFEEPTGVEDGRVRPEVPAEPVDRRPEASGPAPVGREPEPGREAEPGREPVAFPRPSADEYAAYRRPAP